jgi:nitrate reductase NapA
MSISRRSFVSGVAAAAGAVSLPLYKEAWVSDAVAGPLNPTKWQKAPCRFCGTGCGVEVNVDNGKIVAVRGDDKSPVNAGLLCAKGYGLAKVLYGADRITSPLIRNATTGKLEPATWDAALNLIATKWKDLINTYGPDSVAMYGSGQWTIPEGYAALKLMKGGIRTNNLEPNARLCMASAVVGFLKTYGIDEPAGSYDDFDVADLFFLWGSNMAEMHPMLFNRILKRRQANPNVRIISFTTFGTMTDDGADEVHIFKPHSDLYLANAMAKVLLDEGLIDQTFVTNHLAFSGLDTNGNEVTSDFDTYKTFLADYVPEDVASKIGISAVDIRRLAKMLGAGGVKVVSTWTMGVNQHTRGVWMNNLIHNLHLLTGKVAKPGNSPFSLTGQPSACGTCREVGTFSHRLPSDRLVANATHRAEIEAIWGLPAGTIPSDTQSPLTHARAMWDKLASGAIKSVWVQVTNPLQSLPDLVSFRQGAADKAFIIVSDIYPTATTVEADVVLPSACWVEKEGMFGNSERRTQHFAKMVDPPGLAMPDVWQVVQVARKMGYDTLFPTSWDSALEKNLYDEYRTCTLGTHHDVASYDELLASRGMRWPVVNGNETQIRFNASYDPYVTPGSPDGIEFYGRPDGRAVVWARPYEAPPEVPDSQYPLWLCTGRVFEHWHTGTMTRRIPELHRAVPEAKLYMSSADATALGLKSGDMVKVTSKRGEIQLPMETECWIKPPPGLVYVPFFDESRLINEVALGAVDPQSKQPDYKKCAVKVTKA